MSVVAPDLTHPAAVMLKLQQVENDLADRQNAYEAAAGAWYNAKRDVERAQALALLSADETSVTEKRARAVLAATATDGAEHEAEYESLKAVIRVLEARSMILMALLKAQGRS